MTAAPAAASGMTVAATPAAGVRNGPPSDRSTPYRAVLIINGARPGIGAIVPHSGAVLPSSRSGQTGHHAT